MNIIEIINKKKNKKELNYSEIKYIVENFLNNNIKDYQMASLLMAICINDMTDEEVFNLVDCMVKTSKIINYDINSITVDKHSTGGIGDKTTLIIGPIVSSCGVVFPKMSGRGLGYTGGTIDKLESIKNFNVNLSIEEFKQQLKEINISIISQTEDIVEIDKKIYALRNVTATTDSIPLIASSIMSKKIVTNADKIFIDVKYGKGAFLDNSEKAIKLASLMKKIGRKFNKETICLITKMDYPLGNNIGNGLEIKEAINILKNQKDNELKNLCIIISTYIVSMSKNISFDKAKNIVIENINNLNAYKKFKQLIEYQKGDINNINISNKVLEIKSNKTGYINSIDALKIGKICLYLGANKVKLDDEIDYGVGIELIKHVGDYIKENELLIKVYYNEKTINKEIVLDAFLIEDEKQEKENLILGVIK